MSPNTEATFVKWLNKKRNKMTRRNEKEVIDFFGKLWESEIERNEINENEKMDGEGEPG